MPIRFLSPGLHALFDYALVAFLLVAPPAFGWSGAATGFAWTIGLAHLVMTLFTDFHRSVVRVVPFWAHGMVEAGAAAFLVFMGLLTAPANGLLLVVGCAILAVGAVTRYRAADEEAVSADRRPGTGTRPPPDDRLLPDQGWRRQVVHAPSSRR